MEGKIDYMVG